MRVAVLSHFFPPEPCAAANRIEALVKALRRSGHDVTVVTAFPSFPQGRLKKEDRFALLRRERAHGAAIVRLFTLQLGKVPGSRLLHWSVSAAASLLYVLLTRRRFDALVVTSPPITLALPAIAGAWRHRAKLIVDVRDVYPDVAIAMGMWRKDGALAKVVERVARALYRRASLVTTVTPATVAQIASRGVDDSRLVLAANGAEETSLQRSTNGARAQFHAVYTGNVGLAADVEVLVEAARALSNDERFRITILGDGAQAAQIRDRIASAGLKNIVLAGAVPREEALAELCRAHVALVPLRSGISDSIPTKIFDAFSVGCPVIVCADGEAAALVQRCDGGLAVPPGNGEALADALRRFSELSEEARTACGERGRSLVRQFYSRDALMDDLCRRIAAC